MSKSSDFNIYYLNFSKVYEIAMMIDILSGVLSGAGFLNNVNKFYSATNQPMNVGHMFIAIDPNMVYENDFLDLMDQYIEVIRSSKPVTGKNVIVPGDRRKRENELSEEDGIALSEDSAEKLAKILICPNATKTDFANVFKSV